MYTSPLSAARTSVVVALLSIWQWAAAQPAIDLLGRVISVGAERSAVLAELNGFRLECIGEATPSIDKCNSILIQKATPPFDAYANVYFQQNRVKSIRKYWSHDYQGKDPQAFVRTLFVVVSQLQRETGVAPTITTSERRDPGIHQQSILISAGRKSVDIMYAEGLRGVDGSSIAPFVNLTEKAE